MTQPLPVLLFLPLAAALASAAPPLVVNLSPPFAVTSPGAQIVITGEGFTPGTKIFFDGMEARRSKFVSGSQIDVVTPFLRPGEHRLWIQSQGKADPASPRFVAIAAPIDAELDAAMAQAASGKITAALDALQSVAETNEDYQVRAYTYYEMGQICLANGDFNGWRSWSMSIFQDAYSSGPSIQSYWPYRLAIIMSSYVYDMGKSVRNDAGFDQVVDLDVTDAPEPRFERALFDALVGNVQKARRDIDFLLETQPPNAAYLALAALIAQAEGNRSLALKQEAAAESALPANGLVATQALAILGELEYRRGDSLKAQSHWSRMGASAPHSASLAVILARRYLKMGSKEVASMFLSEAIAAAPNTPVASEARTMKDSLQSRP